MNAVDCYVTEINSEPYKSKSGLWCVDVSYDTHGAIFHTTLTFISEEKAKELEVGYKFQAQETT